MPTIINIAYDVPATTIREIEKSLQHYADFEPRLNGIEFKIERDDFTCIADDSHIDKYAAAQMMSEIHDTINTPAGEIND